jgi:hypothetical protein
MAADAAATVVVVELIVIARRVGRGRAAGICLQRRDDGRERMEAREIFRSRLMRWRGSVACLSGL